MRRLALLVLALAPIAAAGEVRVRVLELFHPQRLTLAPPAGTRLTLETDLGEHDLEGAQNAEVILDGGRVVLHLGFRPLPASSVSVDGPVTVRLGDALERTFAGRLTVEPDGGELRLTLRLPLEQAVAAIVAAEAGTAAPPAAAHAQAIATRSFLLASKGRHQGYGFCDTTHCQHFTEASDASREAAEATAGLALTHAGRVVEALSTRRCGGATRALADIGLNGAGYPYFPAACEPCRRQPLRWERTWRAADVAPLLENPGWESARLEVVRRLGWSAVPSNAYALRIAGEQAHLDGQGEGHGVGLCQFGAAALARQGWDAARILKHYFVNASIE